MKAHLNKSSPHKQNQPPIANNIKTHNDNYINNNIKTHKPHHHPKTPHHFTYSRSPKDRQRSTRSHPIVSSLPQQCRASLSISPCQPPSSKICATTMTQGFEILRVLPSRASTCHTSRDLCHNPTCRRPQVLACRLEIMRTPPPPTSPCGSGERERERERERANLSYYQREQLCQRK